MSDPQKGMSPLATVVVSAVTAALVGSTVPWWAQMLLERPTLPASAGTWYGDMLRTSESFELWPISITRDKTGSLVEGEVLTLLFDGKNPSKQAKFKVDPIESDGITLRSFEVWKLPDNRPILEGKDDYTLKLLPATQGRFQLRLFDKAGPYAATWTLMQGPPGAR